MPTVLRLNGYRFFFYSNESHEPPHIHVEKAGCTAKFWLKTVQLAGSYKFRGHELAELGRMVNAYQELFVEQWYEFFDNQN